MSYEGRNINISYHPSLGQDAREGPSCLAFPAPFVVFEAAAFDASRARLQSSFLYTLEIVSYVRASFFVEALFFYLHASRPAFAISPLFSHSPAGFSMNVPIEYFRYT